MGTMLAYIFIEANLSKKNLKFLMNDNIESTFNSITVDGDTSTSDTMMLFSINKDKSKYIVNKKLSFKIIKST